MGPLEVTATYRQPTKDDRTSEVDPLFMGSLTTPYYPPRFLPYSRLFEDNYAQKGNLAEYHRGEGGSRGSHDFFKKRNRLGNCLG